jgi:hypothetical protein
VIDGAGAHLIMGPDEVLPLLQRGGGVVCVVPLAGVVSELDESIHALTERD